MSIEMQQQFYDLITRESEKLANLRNVYNVLAQDQEKIIPNKESEDSIAAEKEKRERLQFEEEMRKEAEEKQILLQAVINESAESGYPLPKSMIKLLHSQNGKKKPFFFFVTGPNLRTFFPFLLFFPVTLISVKHNGRGQSNNIRSVKQDTKDIRSSVLNLESHVKHFNGGMNDLTNYVKVIIVHYGFWPKSNRHIYI